MALLSLLGQACPPPPPPPRALWLARVPAGQALDAVGAARAATVAPASCSADQALVAGARPGPGISAQNGFHWSAPQLHHAESPPPAGCSSSLHLPPPGCQLTVWGVGAEHHTGITSCFKPRGFLHFISCLSFFFQIRGRFTGLLPARFSSTMPSHPLRMLRRISCRNLWL